MKKEGVLVKSKYIGVYKKIKGYKPWITYTRFGELSFSIHSESEEKAALKYNILATFFQGKAAKLNPIEVSLAEYRKLAKELYHQLTLPTEVQKSVSTQDRKKYTDASCEYVGVYKYKRTELYFAYISKDKKRYSLGYYKTAQEAGAAYNIAAKALYGDSAQLNKIDMNSIDERLYERVLAKLDIDL